MGLCDVCPHFLLVLSDRWHDNRGDTNRATVLRRMSEMPGCVRRFSTDGGPETFTGIEAESGLGEGTKRAGY